MYSLRIPLVYILFLQHPLSYRVIRDLLNCRIRFTLFEMSSGIFITYSLTTGLDEHRSNENILFQREP